MLVTLGKQKQPWFKAGNSLFFDGDVNPEGASFQYGGKTGVFANAWGYWLEEMASAADSNVIGGAGRLRLRQRPDAGRAATGTMARSRTSRRWSSPARPPATAPTPPIPPARRARPATVRCYTYDYNIWRRTLQWAGRIGSMPITLFGGYLENMDPDDLNTGYNLGFLLGKAADPHTWEFGVMYEDIEQDAQMAAFLDSDFADGKTQGKG